LTRWNLLDKVMMGTTDSVANIKAAMTALCRTHSFVKFPCAAHTIQLCVNGALADVEEADFVISKCQDLTHLMKQVGLFRKAIENKQLETDPLQTPLSFLDDITTRWNSQYLMMERVIRLYHLVIEVRDDVQNNNPSAEEQRHLGRLRRALLTERELLIAQDLLLLLKPALEFTKMVSSDVHPVLPKVYSWVYDWCNRARPELETDEGNDVYDSLTRHIRTRWPLTGITDTAALATYLCAGWKNHSLFETWFCGKGFRFNRAIV